MRDQRSAPLWVILACTLYSAPGLAQETPLSVSLGARLQFSGWKGDNVGANTSNTSFDAGAGQLSLNVTLQKGRYFGGVNFQGGRFDFSNGAPDRVGATAIATSPTAEIRRGEADFLFGYYFWDQVSLFLDIKNVTNEWRGESYSLSYGGLGVGISGFAPIDERWTFFATFGLVPLNIEAESRRIGDGDGSALEFGVIRKLGERTNLTISLKNQHQVYRFDNGAEQTHDIGGLAFGINHRVGD